MDSRSRTWKWLALPLVASLLVFAAACGDDDDDADNDGATTPAAGTTADDGASTGDEAEVEAAIQGLFDAWNGNDLEGFLAVFTDAGLVATFGEEGAPVEEVQAGLAEFIGSEPISDVTFNETNVDGDNATSDVQFAVGGAFERNEFIMVNETGMWKVDGQEELAVEVPDDYTLVHVDLNEFAFAFNPDDIAGADIAFEAANVGEQQHELAVVRIPADAVVDELLTAISESGPDAPPPPGVEFLGSAADIDPDDTRNLVFADALTAGRYLMLCLFPDTDEGPEGTPHALKGMVSEFAIQ